MGNPFIWRATQYLADISILLVLRSKMVKAALLNQTWLLFNSSNIMCYIGKFLANLSQYYIAVQYLAIPMLLCMSIYILLPHTCILTDTSDPCDIPSIVDTETES